MIETAELTLERQGERAFNAHLAKPDAERRIGVVVLTDMFGLSNPMRGVAKRCAEHGYAALVPNLFWRSEISGEISYDNNAHPTAWTRLKALDFDVILPGHGQAFRGKERIGYFQAYLKDFWAQAEQLHKDGVSAADAARRMDMRAHAAHFPDIKDVGVFPHGVVRVYALLDGTGK